MSTENPNSGGYGGLKTAIFTIGVGILILFSLYVAKCCNSRISIQDAFFRNRLRRRGHHDPSEFSDASNRSTGDEPKISDVWITSWYPSCSQFEGPGLAQQDDGQKRDPDSTTDPQGRSPWAGFLPLSAEKVSGPDTIIPCQLEVDDGGTHTSSTQIQISTVILMPSRPPASFPSTSSPNPTSGNMHDPPREYAFGTSSVSCTPGD